MLRRRLVAIIGCAAIILCAGPWGASRADDRPPARLGWCLTIHEVHPSMTAEEAQERGVPPGYRIVPLLQHGYNETALLVRAEPALDGGDLADAQPSFDQRSGAPVVNFRLSAEGTQKFAAFTARNLDHRMAIVVDGRIVTAPWIRSPIPSGRGYIAGTFTPDMAIKLAQRMRSDTCSQVGA